MKKQKFNGKKIKIREGFDLKSEEADKFLDFINSLVEEKAKILIKNKKTLEEEKEWMKDTIENIKEGDEVFVYAKDREKIVGLASISRCKEAKDHIGEFGILIGKNYRSIGLGKCLMNKVLKKAKNNLSGVVFIRLGVYLNNDIAILLYKKMGFKKVAIIPEQLQHEGGLVDEIIMVKSNVD